MTLTSASVQNSPATFRSIPVLLFFCLLQISGCATPPPPPPPAPLAACPVCEVCQVCVAPTLLPAITEPVPVVPDLPRGRLERATWSALPGFASENSTGALTAFLQSCGVLKSKLEWQNVCGRAAALPANAAPHTVNQFFRSNFEPFRVINADETETGLVTGYYEPLLRGSRVQTPLYKYPVYGSPQDLITVDLSELYPDLKFRRLRGRLVGNKLVPYLDRRAITGDATPDSEPLRGLEIAWVDNAVELFFLEIQGSGQIQLPDGSRMRVGYADQNGHPFRSLGGLLIRRGEIKPERASMQGIKEWARRNPAKVRQFMNANPSFIFFKELAGDLSGPIGTLGVPLTAERSIAVDQRVIPLGVPVFLSTTFPNTQQELNRLMVAQDTGGAINGAVRADFYWGFGDAAGAQAGKMKQQGRMWVLLPQGYDPNALSPLTTPTIATPATPSSRLPTAPR